MEQKNYSYSNIMKILVLIIISISFLSVFLGFIITLTGTDKYIEQYISKTQILWLIGVLIVVSLILLTVSKIKKVDKVSKIKIRKPD